MVLLVVFAIFGLLAIASWFWGADSRPGFSDGRTDRVEHFFFHSKTD
jgi:hypothetical protein